MNGCCQECNESNGNFTYIRFASDQYGSNISLLRNSGGIERCYQAIITSSIRLEETHPSFADYFTGKWFNVCNGESSSDSCCCVKFGFQKPSPKYNVWNFSEEEIQYQNNNSYVNAIVFDNMLNGHIFIVKPIVDNNGNNIQNNKNYYVKFHYDFSNLESEDSVQISLGDGESASILSFDRSSGIGVYEGIMFASSGVNYPNDNLLFSVNTTNDLSANGLIYNFEFGSDKCFVTGPDNKWKKMNFGFAHTIGGLSTIESLAADAINSMYNPTSESDPNYNSNIVSNEEIPLFIGIVYPYDKSPKSFKVALIPNGKGSGKYGQNGNISLMPDDLVLIEKEDLNTDTAVTIIENDPNSNLVDLGDIGSNSFVDVINSSLNPYEITNTVNWYFRFTQNNLTFIYAFIGNPGVYGDGGLQTVLEDFFLVDTTSNSSDLLVNIQNNVTYTLETEDTKGKIIVFNNPNPIIFTIPDDSFGSFPIGSNFELVSINNGIININLAPGVSLNTRNDNPLKRSEVRRYVKISENTWIEDSEKIDTFFSPLSAYLDIINGNDSTAKIEDSKKPFKTMAALISALPATTGETYTIYISGGTVPITRKMPIRNLNFVAYSATTLDFTNCMESDGVTPVTEVLTNTSSNASWSFPSGNIGIISNYSGGIRQFSSGVYGVSLFGRLTKYNWLTNGSLRLIAGSNFIVDEVRQHSYFNTPVFVPTGEVNFTIGNLIIGNRSFVVGGASTVANIDFKKISESYVESNPAGILIKGGKCRVGDINITNKIVLGFVTVDFYGTVLPTTVVDLNEITVVSGTLNSTTYCPTAYGTQVQYYNNFSGKLAGLTSYGGTCKYIFTNCTIETNGFLLRKGVAMPKDLLEFRGINTIINTNPNSNLVGPTIVSPISDLEANVLIRGSLSTNMVSLGNNVTTAYQTATFKEKLQEIVVRSKKDLVNRTLSSSTTYVVDGTLILASGEYIEIPVGGLTLTGYGFDVSKVQKNMAGQSIFKSPVGGSGNLASKDIEYNSGLGSVFDIADSDGSHNIEFNDVNFVGCNSIGLINGYRQFTATTCGIYGCTSGFVLDGTWTGFKMVNTNAFSFGASGKLFSAGATLTFSNRFFIELNLSLPIGAVIADFTDANFLNNKLLQVTNCFIKVNGVIDPDYTPVLFPGITPNSTKSYFVNNIGLRNTPIEPYSMRGSNFRVCDDDLEAASQDVAVGEFYIEATTGYLRQRLT